MKYKVLNSGGTEVSRAVTVIHACLCASNTLAADVDEMMSPFFHLIHHLVAIIC